MQPFFFHLIYNIRATHSNEKAANAAFFEVKI